MDLLASELRVLGCLLEKQRATPDQYPLTLNSLRLACNQSTNRDPVVEYDDETVRDALRRLERRGMVRFAGGAGSRAPKYRHLLAEALPMDDSEQAVIAVLMLRGAQTPGELKQRTERIHPFRDLEEVNGTLARLMERQLVLCLPRRRGQKEERYAQALGGEEPHAGEEPRAGEELPVREDRGPDADADMAPEPFGESVERSSEPSAASAWSEAAGGGDDARAAVAPPAALRRDGGEHQQLREHARLLQEQRELVDRLSERVHVLEAELRELQLELGLRDQPVGVGEGGERP